MVLLTITPAIVEALHKLESVRAVPQPTNDQGEFANDIEASESNTAKENVQSSTTKVYGGTVGEVETAEPKLCNPKIGNPVSHGQIMDIARDMKKENLLPQSLEILVKGAKVYAAPPPPKAEPVSISENQICDF